MLPTVSIILPVRNQGDHIYVVVTGYINALNASVGEVFEILLVPNGCSDSSVSACQTLVHEFSCVRLLQPPAVGWGAAVRCGIDQSVADIICFASSARAKSSDMVRFVERAIETPSFVYQARRVSQDNWIRSLGSRIFNFECRLLFGSKTADINGTPKVFPRRFSRLLSLTRDDFTLDAQFNWFCAEENYPVVEIEVGPTPRHGGQSMTTTMRALELIAITFLMRLDGHRCGQIGRS